MLGVAGWAGCDRKAAPPRRLASVATGLRYPHLPDGRDGGHNWRRWLESNQLGRGFGDRRSTIELHQQIVAAVPAHIRSAQCGFAAFALSGLTSSRLSTMNQKAAGSSTITVRGTALLNPPPIRPRPPDVASDGGEWRQGRMKTTAQGAHVLAGHCSRQDSGATVLSTVVVVTPDSLRYAASQGFPDIWPSVCR